MSKRRYTINSDIFVDSMAKSIYEHWKNDKTTQITFNGSGKDDFLKHINDNYPNAIKLKDNSFCLERTEDNEPTTL